MARELALEIEIDPLEQIDEDAFSKGLNITQECNEALKKLEGNREEKSEPENYTHRGLAQRSFSRAWSLSDDVEVKDVSFADGLLTITLGKIVPEHHAKKVYL